jgi:hypothetical protein
MSVAISLFTRDTPDCSSGLGSVLMTGGGVGCRLALRVRFDGAVIDLADGGIAPEHTFLLLRHNEGPMKIWNRNPRPKAQEG